MRWGLQIFFIHYILFRSSVDIFLTQVTNSSLCTLQFDTSLATLSQAGIRQTGPPRLSWLHGWGCFVKVTWMPSLWRMCCPNWARFLKRCPSLHTNKAWVSDKRFWAALQFLCSWVFVVVVFSVPVVFLSSFIPSIKSALKTYRFPSGFWIPCLCACGCVCYCVCEVMRKVQMKCCSGFFMWLVGFQCALSSVYILPTLLFLFCALRACVRCK